MPEAAGEDLSDDPDQMMDAYAKEIEDIAEGLDTLKKDLEKKESLLAQVESTLEESERELEKKITAINEKDEKLRSIEEILQRKEEEIGIQEEELQTNAALEYLSFKSREEELIERERGLEDFDRERDEYRMRAEQLEQELVEAQERLESAEQMLREGMGDGAGGLSQAAQEELRAREEDLMRKEQELEELKDNLMDIEERLREQEAFLRKEEERLRRGVMGGGGGQPTDEKLIKQLNKKESELGKLEKSLQEKQKEVEGFKEILEGMEKNLKEREREIREREEKLEENRQKVLSGGGIDKKELAKLMKNEEELKFQIDREIKRQEKTWQLDQKKKIQQFMKKIEKLERRNEELENTAESVDDIQLELEAREKELKERYEEMSFQEEKISRREEKLINMRRELQKQADEGGGGGEGNAIILSEELENLQEQIAQKEAELKEMEEKLAEREDFLKRKEKELKMASDRVIESELEVEMAVESERDVDKVSLGVRRLDDMLYGGLPLNSNIMIYGPPFTGKLVLIHLFIADALKKGVPCIYILTDKTPPEIRDSLSMVLPKAQAYERKGLLHFIDAYSVSMGIEADEPNTVYIDKPTDLEEINNAITNIQKTFSGRKSKYHKVAFVSLSTLITYTDAMTVFRFLSTFTSKCKRAHAVSLIQMDEGIGSESDVSTLKHTMNGVFEMKNEELKTYIRAVGIGDVRTRAWVQYSHSSKAFTIKGSFAVDHIR